MNRLVPSAVALIVVVIVLTACAGPGGPGPSASTDPEDSGGGGGEGAIEYPTGPQELVLLVESVGGFVPVDFMATQLPSFALYGDGRVITHGMQTLEYPGPALAPLVERRLTEAGIQAVLEAIEATNLFGSSRELRGAQNVVADAADTVFTVHAAGRDIMVSIYGLGTLMPGMEPPPGMPAGELEAHEALAGLNDRLTLLDSWLPADAWAADGWQPHQPAAFRLYVRDVTGDPVVGDLPEHVMEWPSGNDPAAFGEEQALFGDGTRCGIVTDDEALAWLEALQGAKQDTRWSDGGGRRFSVAPRPLLPHEEAACPDLGG